MKKLIAFDVDGTLVPSKSPINDLMAELLNLLLQKFKVCIISGGKYEIFEQNILSNSIFDVKNFKNLHLMPTCGTRYYIFKKNQWHKVYSEDFTQDEKQRIIKALNLALDELNYREKTIYGELIEDRESQITLSALGQDIVQELGEKGLELKEAWDPDNHKKEDIQKFVSPLLSDFEVKIGGLTSIDITKPGIDKAYGMKKLMEYLHLKKQDILFIGDRLKEGGNDYPVKALGIDSLEIDSWQQTAIAIQAILHIV